MKHELKPEEIVRKLGGSRDILPFITDFQTTLKEKIGNLVEDHARAILSEAAVMYSDDGKGDIAIIITAKVVIEDRKIKVRGNLKYERKTQVKAELIDLVYDTEQPELPFGEEPTKESIEETPKEGKTEEKVSRTDQKLFNEAVDYLSSGGIAKLTYIAKELDISQKKAASIMDGLEKAGSIGPQNEDGTHPVNIPVNQG